MHIWPNWHVHSIQMDWEPIGNHLCGCVGVGQHNRSNESVVYICCSQRGIGKRWWLGGAISHHFDTQFWHHHWAACCSLIVYAPKPPHQTLLIQGENMPQTHQQLPLWHRSAHKTKRIAAVASSKFWILMCWDWIAMSNDCLIHLKGAFSKCLHKSTFIWLWQEA